jgi:hypothetical protein
LGHHICLSVCLSVCLKAQGSDPDVRKSTKDRRILAELSGGENDTESWSRERNAIASSASFGDWNVDENDCKETRRRYVASRREVLSMLVAFIWVFGSRQSSLSRFYIFLILLNSH